MASKTSKIILESFNKLIVENDFHKITVDMIMKAAEVSRATFYRHFKDKYDVMNANFKNLLDFYVSPQKSSNYRDLCFHLFEYGLEHLQVFKKAMESTGFNSFSNFIYEYSYQTALEITKQNRGGEVEFRHRGENRNTEVEENEYERDGAHHSGHSHTPQACVAHKRYLQ